MSPLASPPADLADFPFYVLESPSRLFRIHRAHLGPWWFSSDGTGRFDLPVASEQGTCYLAEKPVGCFLEVFRNWTMVPEQEVETRRLTELTLPTPLRVADCTAGRARELGITAEIHSTPDYGVTQAWATALQAAGFAGVRYFLRHDPGQTLFGVGLFGPAGERQWPADPEAQSQPIPAQVIEEAGYRFGILVMPTP